MDRPPAGGEISPEFTPSPSQYSSIQQPPPKFEQERLVTRKPVPSLGKTHYEQVNPVPDSWQGFPDEKGFQWLPGLWTHVPIPGMLAVIGALICIAGTVAVLVRSDGMPVTDWTLSPTVYIALMTTGTNMLLRFAFHEGNKIAWWYRAIQGGTLRDLHTRWESGDGFWGALGAGRNFNLVSLASLAATFIVIDQPLIQRASTIVPAQFSRLTNVTATIAPEIPYGYTGAQYGRGSYQQVMTQPMISAFNDYNTQASITTGFAGCSDTCTGFVDAGGLAAECTTISGPIAYLQSPKTNASNDILDSAFLAQSPFNVNFTLVPQMSETNASYILMMVSYTTDAHSSNCGGTLIQRSCKLQSATLRYPITLKNSTLELGNITTDATIQSFQPAGNNSISIDGGSDYDRWTLGGLYLAATSLFQANATYQWIGALGNMLTLPDTLSNQFLETPIGNDTLYGLGLPAVCSSNWTDPTSHILSALNQIAFRVSINAAGFPFRNTTSPPSPQILTMQEVRTINVFQSVYRFLAASTVLTVVCVALVLPTFIGWWELGRSVTLNPLELAKAFDAPLLSGPGSNAPLHELVQTMGMRNVRYGEVEGRGQLSRRELKLADPQELVRPSPGVVYE
ncbi:uncharacterized protein LY89DRAFT_314228 [Mollisia scopiformis]|uniref:Uncharacterized protein n=1 Tax=Mollisia scopiformis TaxID=149040 RepID=A0A194XS05_MOLSC|nr:uncharacterized protein LY89DRAFT_314228 [Mollisia scopiformis]KUJ22926.1 hypothetical protein LY89DRAFT_314228 [Mollisia scopiformis]